MHCAAAYRVHPLRQHGSSQHSYDSCLGRLFTPPRFSSFLEEAAAVEFLHRGHVALLVSCIPESRLYAKFPHQKSFTVGGPLALPSFFHHASNSELCTRNILLLRAHNYTIFVIDHVVHSSECCASRRSGFGPSAGSCIEKGKPPL